MLDDATRRLLSKFEKKYNMGAILFREGDEGQELYYVIEGEVEAIRSSAGKVYVRNSMKEGDYFGEMSFLVGQKRTATVTCLTDCVFLVFPPNALNILIEKKADIAIDVMKGLAHRLLNAEERLEKNMLDKSCLFLAQYIYIHGSESGKKAIQRVEIPMERIILKVSDSMGIPLSLAEKAISRMAELGHFRVEKLRNKEFIVVEPSDKIYNQEDWAEILQDE